MLYVLSNADSSIYSCAINKSGVGGIKQVGALFAAIRSLPRFQSDSCGLSKHRVPQEDTFWQLDYRGIPTPFRVMCNKLKMNLNTVKGALLRRCFFLRWIYVPEDGLELTIRLPQPPEYSVALDGHQMILFFCSLFSVYVSEDMQTFLQLRLLWHIIF